MLSFSTPFWIRTRDHQLRRLLLYSTELRVLIHRLLILGNLSRKEKDGLNPYRMNLSYLGFIVGGKDNLEKNTHKKSFQDFEKKKDPKNGHFESTETKSPTP